MHIDQKALELLLPLFLQPSIVSGRGLSDWVGRFSKETGSVATGVRLYCISGKSESAVACCENSCDFIEENIRDLLFETPASKGNGVISINRQDPAVPERTCTFSAISTSCSSVTATIVTASFDQIRVDGLLQFASSALVLAYRNSLLEEAGSQGSVGPNSHVQEIGRADKNRQIADIGGALRKIYHDLNNISGVLSGNLELALEDISTGASGVDHCLGQCLQACDRVQESIKKLRVLGMELQDTFSGK